MVLRRGVFGLKWGCLRLLVVDSVGVCWWHFWSVFGRKWWLIWSLFEGFCSLIFLLFLGGFSNGVLMRKKGDLRTHFGVIASVLVVF